MTSATSDVVLESKGFRVSIHGRNLGLLLAGVLVAALIAGIWVNRREERAAAASQALFLAQKTLGEEQSRLAESLKKPAAPALKKEKQAPASPVAAPDISYRKLNVEESFRAGVAGLQQTAVQYAGTRAGTEAALDLGDLYYRHGQWDKAREWFEKTRRGASASLDQVSAWAGEAYSFENLGKPEEAVAALERGLQVGEEAWKGDLLLALARNQAALKKADAAQATYERILKELPGTEASTVAEALKARMGSVAHP